MQLLGFVNENHLKYSSILSENNIHVVVEHLVIQKKIGIKFTFKSMFMWIDIKCPDHVRVTGDVWNFGPIFSVANRKDIRKYKNINLLKDVPLHEYVLLALSNS